MSEILPVTSCNDGAMDALCRFLQESAADDQSVDRWPAAGLRQCGASNVYRWFLSENLGGLGWSESDQTLGYLKLAQSDLTTTFVITQYMGAIRRIAASENDAVAQRWLSSLISGESFATVGISHLTTSSRHLSRPVLSAIPAGDGWILNGMSPWVTGAPHADLYVVGATLEDDGREILVAVERKSQGVQPGPGIELVALTSSCTDRVTFDHVRVDASHVLAGPCEHVLQTGVGARTGGLQTSTLALGLAQAAVEFIHLEASKRAELQSVAEGLRSESDTLRKQLLRAAGGDDSCVAADIRGQANRFVLRATQAALTSAKGAGFTKSHAVGRWCRQALFFLVWSCPQGVAQSHLCELAGIEA